MHQSAIYRHNVAASDTDITTGPTLLIAVLVSSTEDSFSYAIVKNGPYATGDTVLKIYCPANDTVVFTPANPISFPNGLSMDCDTYGTITAIYA